MILWCKTEPGCSTKSRSTCSRWTSVNAYPITDFRCIFRMHLGICIEGADAVNLHHGCSTNLRSNKRKRIVPRGTDHSRFILGLVLVRRVKIIAVNSHGRSTILSRMHCSPSRSSTLIFYVPIKVLMFCRDQRLLRSFGIWMGHCPGPLPQSLLATNINSAANSAAKRDG